MKKIFPIHPRPVRHVMIAVMVTCVYHGVVFGQENTLTHGRSEKMVVKIDAEQERAAKRVLDRNAFNLMGITGVVATATGVGPDGRLVIKVFTAEAGTADVPSLIEGMPVVVKTTGRFRALAAAGRHTRPVPIGASTGHGKSTAGTIGARVTDGVNIFALSNNHVYANSNDAIIGDVGMQPGPHDGSTRPDDSVGTLFAFKAIEYCHVYYGGYYYSCPQTNTIDAAIADVVDPDTAEPLVDFGTPSDGYGAPSARLHAAYGRSHAIDDADENLSQLIGQSVQKYGRSTGLTEGIVDAIYGTVDVCYNEDCTLVARFEDQIIITPGSFSDHGDSGSLIVTNDEDKQPVGLLYAGSDTITVANRIDRVLIEFGVQIDTLYRTVEPESAPEPEPICITANNRDHITAGRAYGCGYYWGGSYTHSCAAGAGDNLGLALSRFSHSSSIQETSPGYWELVVECP